MRKSILALILAPSVLVSEPITSQDGPWIDVNDDMIWTAQGYNMNDIIILADLDGDPSVTTDDERAMIALLSQVLGAAPVSN